MGSFSFFLHYQHVFAYALEYMHVLRQRCMYRDSGQVLRRKPTANRVAGAQVLCERETERESERDRSERVRDRRGGGGERESCNCHSKISVDQSNRPCDLKNSHPVSQGLFGSIRTAAACACTGNEVKSSFCRSHRLAQEHFKHGLAL